MGRARGQQEQPVGEPDRLVDVVGDEQRGDPPARHQRGELVAQAFRERVVEGHEGLVEHQEVGLDREGAGERDAAGLAERQFAGEMIAMGGEPERGEQHVEFGVGRLRRAEPHVLLHGAPGQEARLLEHHAELAVIGQAHHPGIVAVEAGDDAQQRRLAAAGGADQGGHRPGGEGEFQPPQHVEPTARRRPVGFAFDADIKLGGDASGRHVVQSAAPGMFQSPA